MNTVNMVDMKKRPPHKLDIMATAVYGDETPNLFREGKYYDKGNLVYTYNTSTGDIDVWECEKSGIYGRPAEPGWSPWSMNDIRERLGDIEELLSTEVDVYDIQDYQKSYYLQDVGVRDWEHRGSFVECFNNNKYIAKKHYKINENEQIVAVDGETLPTESDTTLYLNKSANKLTNLVRRIEMYGTIDSQGRIPIPYPLEDMSLISSYMYDLYIDGVYISQNFISTVKDENGNRCAVVSFDDMPISQENQYKIDDGLLSIVQPIDSMSSTSEFVFIFYLSISHDLTLEKTDYDVFIGGSKDSKWFDISELGWNKRYQEISVFNNGIKMRPELYTITESRVSVDEPDNRFLVGSVATVSMKTFTPVDEDVVPNVKEETIPITTNNKLLPIPFLNYDENVDHFLVFNDAGILLGNQKWFDDNGYINLYDDDNGFSSGDMVEFRMISRDQNMEVRSYIITTAEDNQTTYEMPVRLRDVYFHMIFTESGQYISRTKYALSGTLLQFRADYAHMLKGERFELICFNYTGKYGFTKMTNYKSIWNPEYAEKIVDTLANAITDSETPVVPDEPVDEGPQYEEGAWDNLIKNEDGTTIHYTPPEPPGTRCTLIQDRATVTLKPKVREDTGKPITESAVSYVLGVDADNQIICSTYEGDILRFDSEGNEDTRYALKRVTNGTIQILETDDFGNTYFKPFSSVSGNVDVIKIDRQGNQCWSMRETNEGTEDFYCANVYSMKYLAGWLYIEYCPHGTTERTMAKINADTGKFYKINIEVPAGKYTFSASLSTLNGNKIYLGSEGHMIIEYEQNGMFSRKFTDLVEDFTIGSMTDVYCDGKYVYGICTDYNTGFGSLIKYDMDGNLLFIKDYGCEIYMTFDVDGNVYIFEALNYTITKFDRDTGNPIWSHVLSDSVSNFNNFFVDPVNYHVYAYYVNNNNSDNLRYTELEQNGLPLPKYTHNIVFNGDQNVTTTDLIGSSVREINYLPSPNNRLYIGTQDGSVYSFTQRMKEMSKKRTVKLWKEENPDIPRYIIPDADFNFYVITENIIEKWNRYERKLWRYDGRKTITSILDRIVLNPVTKDLVFLYGDTDGRHSLGRLSEDGDFEQLNITLPNGVKVEDADCAIACDENGNYLFGYSGHTVYAYTKNFGLGSKTCYGLDTDAILGGYAGNIVTYNGNVYVTIKNENEDVTYDKLVKFSSNGNIAWEHDFMGSSMHGSLMVDKDGNVYAVGGKEIRKIDPNGAYIWRFKYEKEDISVEPKYIFMDEFYRIFFVNSDYSLHRIDQYDLTYDPIPDEDPEPLEPKEPDEPATPPEIGYVWVQNRFDIPFEYDDTTSSMMLFTNSGQYVGKRFYDIYKDQIVLKGTPVYENGWLDIILIENVKESIEL